jgi:hypothetical protein
MKLASFVNIVSRSKDTVARECATPSRTTRKARISNQLRIVTSGALPILFLPLVLTTLVSCKHRPSPNQIVSETRALGVYSLSGTQVTEIANFGVEDDDLEAQTMGFTFTHPIQTAAPDTSFIVNLPNADISDSKLFLLQDPAKARWDLFHPDDKEDPQPIKTTTMPISSGIYQVSSGERNLPDGRILCLWVRMPTGTPDRLYALRMKR